ncbi:hypothetical protein B5E53_17025 [Eubacterium sp. An11]|nr:hypothetical protein B5E53_17025 [Eubacterium sp. An11]
MRDSGVEWIGKIPFGWICCKQKYEIKLLNGRAYCESEFEDNGKYRILRVGNLFQTLHGTPPAWNYQLISIAKMAIYYIRGQCHMPQLFGMVKK